MSRPGRAVLIVAIGLATLPGSALAASWAKPQKFDAPDGAGTPTAAMAPDGRALVTWRVDDREDKVLATRSTARGRFSRAETVARARRGVEGLTAGLTANGRALLAWSELGAAGHTGVVTAQATSRGSFGAPEELEIMRRRPIETAALLDPAGAALVTWEAEDGLHIKERPSVGAPFAASRPLSDERVFNWSHALGAGGRRVAAWTSGRPFTVKARQWTLGGELGPVAPLSTPGRMAREPAAAATADGFVVAWSESDARTYRVKVAVAGPDGQFGPAQFASAPDETARVPRVAVDRLGTVVVAWQSGGPRQGFPLPHGLIRVATAPRPGAAFDPPVDLTGPAERVSDLQLAAAGGDIHLMWTWGLRNEAKQVVVSSRPAGAQFEPPQSVSPVVGLSGAAIAADSGERAVVAWAARASKTRGTGAPARIWIARRLP